ncbi:MAG: hypothetical protein U1E60_17730 [Reyranellaceae bacterium]
MRRIPSFVYGNVAGAVLIGAGLGAFVDLKAMLVFPAVLAANSVIVCLICWWRPGFEAAAWKLWLTATLVNPLLLAGIAYSIDEYECLIGRKTGWGCMLSGLGLMVAGVCLAPPITGLLVRWVTRWRGRREAGVPAG